MLAFDKISKDNALFDRLVKEASIWAGSHGLTLAPKSDLPSHTLILAPITLIPTQFPRVRFDQAKNLATVFNQLIHEMSQNS